MQALSSGRLKDVAFIACATLCLTFCIPSPDAWAQESEQIQESEQNQESQQASEYVVRPGDTLFSIANRFGVSVDDLRSWNDLGDQVIRAGMTLRTRPADQIVPDSSVPADSSGVDEIPTEQDAMGTDQQREDLDLTWVQLVEDQTEWSIAVRYAVHPDSLHSWNPDVPRPLSEGDSIRVPSGRLMQVIQVKRGDTLYSIARAHGISVSRLQEMNDMQGSSIRVGQRLRVPPASSQAGAAPLLDGSGPFVVWMYPSDMQGRRLASGSSYNPQEMTLSHPSLPLGTVVMLTRADSSVSVFGQVMDRSMVEDDGVLEVSEAVLNALGIESPGYSASVEMVVAHQIPASDSNP